MAKQEPGQDILDAILGWEEGDIVDFKRLAGKCVQSVVKTAVAMANGIGGLIVLGVEDPKKACGRDRLYGVEENPDAAANIRRAFEADVEPPLVPPNCALLRIVRVPCLLRDDSDGQIQVWLVEKSNCVHNVRDGGTYIRRGSQNRQLSAGEITNLSLQRGVQSAVDAPRDVDWKLLETSWWREYAEKRQLTRDLPDALLHIGLTENDPNGTPKPKMAAVLLFAEHPGGLLNTKCAIRILHYRGHEVEYREDTNLAGEPITVDGPLIEQIRAATSAVMNELNSGVHVSRRGFEFHQRYPRRVVQEAITNAVLHRDYRINADIQIRIFTNRIEVYSPGGFPGAITAENIRQAGTRPRNPSLVGHLRDFPQPPNLDAGEGVKMMFETLRRAGLYPPVFEELTDQASERVLVRLFNEAKLSDWELVQDYLAEHETVCNADVRRILNVRSSVKVSKLLRDWVNKKLLCVANPDAGMRYRRYRLPAPRGPSEMSFRELGELLKSAGFSGGFSVPTFEFAADDSEEES